MTREEAIKRIKARFDKLALDDKDTKAIQTLIPELCENEDEKTRKEIIDFILWAEDRGMTRHDYHQAKRPAVWIAYLEKQKEQKPTERSLEDDHIIGFVYDLLNEIEWKDNWAMSKEECLRLLNNYRPHNSAGWSEEDKKMIDHLIEALPMWANGRIAMLPSIAEEYVERLKSLRPQTKQEWSEEEQQIISFAADWLTRMLERTDVPEAKRDIESVILGLKSLRPQPQWKPNKDKVSDNLHPEETPLTPNECYWKPSKEQLEVDLEKEIERFYGMYRDVEGEYRDLEDNMIVCPWYEGVNQLWIKDFARHFYELGLNARKED